MTDFINKNDIYSNPLTRIRMQLISNHKLWWSLLLLSTVVVSVATTTSQITLTGLTGSVLAHLIFSLAIAGIPWLVYLIVRRPLNTEQMMSTITVSWVFLTVANILVIPQV